MDVGYNRVQSSVMPLNPAKDLFFGRGMFLFVVVSRQTKNRKISASSGPLR